MILTVKDTETGWKFTATKEDETVSELVAVQHGDDVVIHNEVYQWNKENAKLFQEMFFDVRGFLREKGVRYIIPLTDKNFHKTKRYWKLMGFECFGEVDGGVFAVMEA